MQLSQLRSEVNNMRQMVTLSLLQQQNASERLKGVNWAYRVEQSDTEVLSALLYTVNHDQNVNVRLAAVDALRTFSDSPVARKGLVQAIAKQDSPMVQVSLIDTLAEIRDHEAVPMLQALAKDAKTSSEVRQRAQWALGRMQ
jgi:HEAT repeat protein